MPQTSGPNSFLIAKKQMDVRAFIFDQADLLVAESQVNHALELLASELIVLPRSF